jgi:hypothetical protein
MAAPERTAGPDLAEDPAQDSADAPQRLLEAIWPLLGRHVAFHRRLVDVTANVKAALLLSQAIYWTRHGRDMELRDGWFHKTAGQWQVETGLSVKEQGRARELLQALDLLEDQRLGMPARLHFRLNLDALGRRIADRLGARMPQPPPLSAWRDRALVAELLGPSVAFHRVLVDAATGVHGALLLSRALHLTRLQVRARADPWIAGSIAHWFAELGLTRREQEAARRMLVDAGLWEEQVGGTPPTLHVRVQIETLAALLSGSQGVPEQAPDGPAPVCGVTSDSDARNVETRLRDSHIHVSPKAPSLFRPNRPDCLAQTAALYKEGTTGVSLQPPQPTIPPLVEPPDGHPGRDGSAVGGRCGGGESLIFPERLLAAEQQAIAQLLAVVASGAGGDAAAAQTLLDELAGRLQTERVRSPVAYLRGLIQRAAAGQFVPELAPRVAAERDRQRREAEARRAQQVEERRLAAERATPEYQARERERRERVGALLRDVRHRIAKPAKP